MKKSAKSEALNRKKEELATENTVCKKCGLKKEHSIHKDKNKTGFHPHTTEERAEAEVEREESKEEGKFGKK